jgi:glycosyltransferase involved in cell wall biosynthesis
MSARKLRVLEMIDKPFLGGGQVHVLTLAGALNKDAFVVLVAAGAGGPLETEAVRAGHPFVPVKLAKSLSSKTARDIAAVLRERKIDILHTHGGIAGLFGRRAARRAGTPVVVHTLHGIHYLHYRNPLLRAAYAGLERRLAGRTDAVIVVSDADAATAKRHRLVPADKICVIRNGIAALPAEKAAAEKAAASELRKIIPSDGPLVGAIARLHRQKGIIHLIRAAPAILSRFPAAKIAVAGGGPLEEELRRETGRLGVGRRFLLLGERADAADLAALSDVFVLPSLWEGLPLALLEAAALGRPIVATDIDGVREVVRDGETALLVPPGDHKQLANAVIRLLEDRDLAARLGARARAEIPGLFTLSGMIGAIEKLYLDLAARKGVS